MMTGLLKNLRKVEAVMSRPNLKEWLQVCSFTKLDPHLIFLNFAFYAYDTDDKCRKCPLYKYL